MLDRNKDSRRLILRGAAVGLGVVTLSHVGLPILDNDGGTDSSGNDSGSSLGSDQIITQTQRTTRRGLFTGIGNALAQCIGPNVPCTTPDGIARHSFAEVFRIVKNGGENYAISDAAVRVYVLKPIGTSDYPELDRQNPRLDADGLPAAFRDTKYDLWRDVEKRFLFKAAEPGDPRFNGKLIDTETGLDHLEVKRRGDEIKDRVVGKLRDSKDCGPAADNCVLNCAEVVVFERQKSGTDTRPFVNSLGQTERFQAALWAWELNEPNPSVHRLVSFTNVSDDQIRKLIASGEAVKGLSPKYIDLQHQMEVVK